MLMDEIKMFWEKLSQFCVAHELTMSNFSDFYSDTIDIRMFDEKSNSVKAYRATIYIDDMNEKMAEMMISNIIRMLGILEKRTESKNMKVFICGPTKGHPQFDKALFDKTEKELIQQGFIVFNPAWMDFSEGWSDVDKKAINLAIMARCDAVYPLPGWFESDVCCVGVEYNFSKSSEMILLGKDSEGLFYRIRG